MYKRPYFKQVKSGIEEPRKFIQVILGPRQVGKTAMVNQLLSQLSISYVYESADAIAARNSAWLMQVWETVRLRMKASGASEYLLVIDEIQKIDNWSEVVKQQWDKDTREKVNIKVILLGSSRLLIQKGLTELLAGRIETIYLDHWSFAEMEADCGLLGELDKYAGSVIRQRSSSTIFQIYNNALLTSQDDKTYSYAIVNPKLWRQLVKSSVGAHLLNHSVSERYNLHYWREGNNEVDFILEKRDKVIGLEVKCGASVDNKGMDIINERFHPEKMLLVGTEGIPYVGFLKINPKELF